MAVNRRTESRTDTRREGTTSAPLPSETCNVGLRLTVRKQPQDYESVEVSVSLHVPCEVDEIDEIWNKVERWVSESAEAALDGALDDFFGRDSRPRDDETASTETEDSGDDIPF